MSPTPERWRTLEELIHVAREIPVEERAAFLQESCPDQSLRRQVENLLNFLPESEVLPKQGLPGIWMGIDPGTELGPYRIVARIGAGGMGEVYKARDTRLEREVALKVLPTIMTGDASRRRRLVREAQIASRLNHPNIVTVYDTGESAGRVFIAMEYVAGKPLQARIPPGGLQLEEALRYARPIAAALAAAHEAGIVHRDLKPGNIMVTPDGAVKVLDFGLARMTQGAEAASDADLKPTMSASGIILGTPSYMAPEQAQGKRVDKRADIWAFGVVLYEMLTGERLFKGGTAADTLAAVLTFQPNWQSIPKRAQRLLRRCLEKDPQRRLRDIGDVWDLLEPDVATPSSEPPAATRKWMIASLLLAITAIAGLWTAWRTSHAGAAGHPLTRVSVDLGPEAIRGISFTAEISPDGRRLVFLTRGANGRPQLATRLLDQDQPTLLPGTENGVDPFFSPDGEWIGFFSGRQMKKISVHGGAPMTLCTAGDARGASWGEDGYIVAAVNSLASLVRVPEAGGSPQAISVLAVGEGSHRWPQILPGGRVLFIATAFNIGSGNGRIEVLTLKTGQVKILPQIGYGARYVPTGHLVYVHQGIMYGVRFDLDTLETRGTSRPLLEDVSANPMTGGGQFSFSGPASNPDLLVYLAGRGPAVQWQLMWLESSGKMQSLKAEPGVYTNPRISPDGRKLAVLNGTDIYVRDLERDTTTRLVTGEVTLPIWAPDSQHLVY
ncbi:MAG: protein kinase, partial [Acidobacteriia bacterium]|nr:protein kinase [Terriglobia bacterium]